MKDSFLEKKKINTLLYTNKLKKLLIYPNYIDYDKKMYYESVKRLDNLKIMDESVKENIYTLMNYERDNNLFDNNKINEIIRITNCSSSDKTDKFYYNEFKKRIGKLEKIIEINELWGKVKELEYDDVKKSLEKKIKELKKELADLDKEKVASIAKDKARTISIKAEELYNMAVEKGTPVLEKAANEVRQKTIDVLNKAVEKLDKEEKKSPKKVK